MRRAGYAGSFIWYWYQIKGVKRIFQKMKLFALLDNDCIPKGDFIEKYANKELLFLAD